MKERMNEQMIKLMNEQTNKQTINDEWIKGWKQFNKQANEWMN